MLCGVVLLLSACSKDEGTDAPAGNNTGSGTGSVPAAFTQKVLMEIFTGAGQSQSTDGFAKLSTILTANSIKTIPVHIHFADGMEIAQYTTLTNTFANNNPMTIPSAMINRTPSLSSVILNRTQWQSNFDVNKTKTARCGLAIETSISGNMANIIVHAGFNQALTGNHTITVYLLEDDVTGTGNLYDQRNAYHLTAGHPYFGQGDPIVGFKHLYSLRKVLSAPLGDAIDPNSQRSGGKDIKTYTTSITGFNAAKLSVVAFITKTGASATTHEVMNVQRVKLGDTQSWD